jgi:hypothetical protein
MIDVGFGWSSFLDIAPAFSKTGLYALRMMPPAQMINLQFGWSGMLAIALVAAGGGLYFLRTMRPGLARDQDVFFAAVALLCGGILLFQGWRLDPILQFAQFLSVGSAIWFGFEAVRLRGVTAEQAKRSTPVVDDERPVSRVYRAELDELTPLDERSNNAARRIRGSREGRDSDFEDVRSPASRRSERPRRSRAASRPLPPERTSSHSAWDDDFEDDRPARSSTSSRAAGNDADYSDRPRRNRPQSPSNRRRNGEAPSSDYVDYQPVDSPDGGNFY